MTQNRKSFEDQLRDYRKKENTKFNDFSNKNLEQFIMTLQHFDQVLLKDCKNKHSYYEKIHSKDNYLEQIQNLKKNLIDIKKTAASIPILSEVVNDNLVKLDDCLSALDHLRYQNFYGVDFCYKNFVVGLVDQFWNFKYKIETAHLVLQEKYPAFLPETQQDLNLLDLPEDNRQEIFSYLSPSKKFEQRLTSKQYRESLFKSFTREKYKPYQAIKSISKIKQFSTIEKFLNDYRASYDYKNLIKKLFNQMSTYEKICFSLTRHAKDTHKIIPEVLKDAINQIKESLPKNIIESLRIMMCALEYSNEMNAQAKETINKNLRIKLNNRKFPATYLNLSGMDLQNIVIYRPISYYYDHPALRLIDLTESNLANAKFHIGLHDSSLIDANITGIYIGGPAGIIEWQLECHPEKNESIRFFSETMLQSHTEFYLALNKIWDQFQKHYAYDCGTTHGLYEVMTYNIRQSIHCMNADFGHKLNLIDMTLQHPMFRMNPVIEDMKQHVINPCMAFFKPNQYHLHAPYFRRLMDYAPQTLKLVRLRENLYKLWKEENKDQLYYDALRCLSV